MAEINHFQHHAISDGISMGTEGMGILVSREVIADSIETVIGCEGFDGFLSIEVVIKYACMRNGNG